MATAFSRSSRLARPDRVGRWSRTRAERLRYDWALRNWRFLAAVVAAFAGVGVLMLLLPLPGYDMLAGAVFASGAWAVVGLVYVMSGSASPSLGSTAEAWTASDLRHLAQSGWQVAHGVCLRARGDIDHVALGSGGLLVVETKWSGTGWDGRFADDRTSQAIEQVRRNARDLRLMLPRVRPVIPLVVLWGHPGPPEPVSLVDDVTIIGGAELSDWVAQLAAGSAKVLERDELEKAAEVLSRHVERRDLRDETAQPAHVNFERIINQVMFGTIAGMLSVLALAFVTEAWAIPLSAATALLAWRFRHRSRHPLALTAAAITAGVPTVLLILFVAAAFALRPLM